MKDYLEASKDAFLNSFISFSNSNDALRARVPVSYTHLTLPTILRV